MPVPSYTKLWKPLLLAIAKRGGSAPAKELYEPLADEFQLPREQRAEKRADGVKLAWENEVQWARNELRKQGLVDNTAPRGIWKITPKAVTFLQNEGLITPEEARALTGEPSKPADSEGQDPFTETQRDGVDILDPWDTRQVWWVNQGQTYEQERAGGYLWAAIKDSARRPQVHGETLAEVRPGDIIVHHDRQIRAISRATTAATAAPRPAELPSEAWQQEGRLIHAEYHVLATPIPVDAVAAELQALEIQMGPLTRAGSIKKGYLWRLGDAGLAVVQQASAESWPTWALPLPVANPTSAPRLWWVYQGKTHGTATNLGVVWVPPRDEKRPVLEFERIQELRPGDVLIHSYWGKVRGLSCVASSWEVADRPAELVESSFDGPGRLVRIKYHPLTQAVPHEEISDSMRSVEPEEGPWHQGNNATQGSVWPTNGPALRVLRKASPDPWPDWAEALLDINTAKCVRSWIFQANPAAFDAIGAATSLSELTWLVAAHKTEIKPGDRAFIWESGPNAGLVAVATVLSSPTMMRDDPGEGPFARDPARFAGENLRVRIRVDAVCNPRVPRATILSHPSLAAVKVFSGVSGTNFQLAPEQAEALLEIVQNQRATVPAFEAILSALAAQGLYFPREFVSNYLLALQVKRFVILSGISGTGKTQLALSVAKHYRQRLSVTTPMSIPQGALPLKVQPSYLKYQRFMLPKALFQQMRLPEMPRGKSSGKIPVEYPAGKTSLLLYVDVRESRTAIPVLFNPQFRAWFEENLKLGDTFFLDIMPSEDDGPDGLRVYLPGGTETHEELQDTYQVVAVRPDWTDNRELLGYYNPITAGYRSTPFLELILRATNEWQVATDEKRPAHPYFVILDEMNLARVEHYFSDFLSCLESNECLHLHDDLTIESGDTDQGTAIPRTLAIPPNLFITGTVNVDETTHMFSPKVLDRAFTLEFNEVDLVGLGAENADDNSPDRLSLDAFRGDLCILGKPSATDWHALGEVSPALRSQVVALHALLQDDHCHFGYRVANEIAAFVALAAQQADQSPETLLSALDLALLQKVLPKFHGTQQELERPLQAVFSFAIEGSAGVNHAMEKWHSVRGLLQRRADPAGGGAATAPAAFPRTAAKVWRMLRRLQAQGFTSFME